MSFLLPWMLIAGGLGAAGVVALHLLSTQRPPQRPLPTARFVPESDVRAVSRTSRPTDIPLMLLRALAVLLIGAAFAQPLPDAPGPSVRRVVALEWTTALADPAAALEAARAAAGEGGALVLFDTAARVIPLAALEESLPPLVRAVALSPMLVAIHDAAAPIARGADSLAVAVFSTFPAESWDAATPALRASWPGRIEVTRVAAALDTAAAPAVQLLPDDADDALRPALTALPAARGAHPLRVRRAAMQSDDSLWLDRTRDAVLLLWPAVAQDSLRPDGVYAALGTDAVVVAPLARRAVAEGRVVARWRDGAPAVTERALGLGCIRDVGIGLPIAGDLTLREPFQRLLGVLVEPCGGQRSAALDDSTLAAFAGEGPLAAASAFSSERAASPLTPWLLALALVLLVAEQFWRRRIARRVT